MARLQILELPEGNNDDRPPFVLVVDQMPADEPSFEALRRDLADGNLAERIGARAVLVFEDTIDIPANDTSAYLTPLAAEQELVVNVSDHDVRQAIAADMRKMRGANEEVTNKPRRDWCCSLAFQTLGTQHIDDCKQGAP